MKFWLIFLVHLKNLTLLLTPQDDPNLSEINFERLRFVKKSKTLPRSKFLLNPVSRLLRFPGHVHYSVKLVGGVHKIFIKTFKIFAREGISGVTGRFTRIVRMRENTSKLIYRKWVIRYDTLTAKSKLHIREIIKKFTSKPLISILMTTNNSKSEWLIETIESLRHQLYPHWQLCIADNASANSEIRPLLERYAQEDPRIKVIFSKKTVPVTELFNAALKTASGEWLAILDPGDFLSEQALFWAAHEINEHPGARLIYSDEDKIGKNGDREDPYFKCDWNPDLFCSQNMLGRLCLYHTRLVKKNGGFRFGFENAVDYDLALRFTEKIKNIQIRHIPRVLYHERIHPLNKAISAEINTRITLASVKALDDHLKRMKIKAEAEPSNLGFRVRYQLPPNPPTVSLIIPTRNGFKLIKTCIDSILKMTTYPNYEIIVVDNGSDDKRTLRYLSELPKKVRVIRDDSPFNYSALNNMAVKAAKGAIVGLINNDLEVISPDWLSEMVSHAVRPGIGAVGARLWYPKNSLQHGGVIIGIGGVAGHSHKHIARNEFGYFGRAALIQNLSAVTAACLIVKKSIYNEVHGLNERDLKVAYNDVDFCLKIREKGYRNLYTPYAELYHHESASRGYENNLKKRRRMLKEVRYMEQRWGDQLLNDPAYSPNLTLKHENFGLAWPPRTELIKF
jgi:glycosyltransferase involved in cell wall biosynthesis